jgi:glycyl-radical enzyme activating protein
MNGTLFNIQRFSTHDGPGIRTVVFFKGCTLRCAWCHNPESIDFAPALLWNADRCIGCGRCVPVCPTGAQQMTFEGGHRFDRSLCNNCLLCVDSCYAEALQRAGETMTAETLMTSILSDIPYYGKTGGVTFSGGECLAQPAFLAEVLKQCREAGIHTAVDTAGAVPWQAFEQILPYTDLFLYDVKAMDPELHRTWTGADNKGVLENLKRLLATGAPVQVRIPFVPQANAGEMGNLAKGLAGMGIGEVTLLPYHRLGEGKKRSLGLPAEGDVFTPPTAAEQAKAEQAFADHGIRVCRLS